VGVVRAEILLSLQLTSFYHIKMAKRFDSGLDGTWPVMLGSHLISSKGEFLEAMAAASKW
jgi:hypothetical protein